MKKTLLFFTFLLALSSLVFAKDFGDSEISIYNEVTAAFDTGFYPGAVEKANLLQKEYPDSVFVTPALVQKSEALLNLKRYDEAKDSLEEAISRMHTGSEDFSRCYFLLGKVLYLKKDYNESLSAFHSACVVSHTDKNKEFYNPSILYSARIYYVIEEYQKSLSLFEYVIKNGNEYSVSDFEEAVQKLLIAYNKIQKFQNAVNLYKQIPKDSVSENAWFAMSLIIGESYENLNQNETAYEIYSTIIENAPSVYAVAALKRAYNLATNVFGYVQAEDFAKSMGKVGDNPALVSEFWTRLGIDEYNQNNYEKAKEYFTNAGESAVVILYQQKIVLDSLSLEGEGSAAGIAQVEQTLVSNKEKILSSDFENINDSYYSLYLQTLFMQKKWSEIPSVYTNLESPDSRAVYQNAAALYKQNLFTQVIEFLNPLLTSQTFPAENNPALWELYASSFAKNGNTEYAMNSFGAVYSAAKLSNAGKIEYAKVLFTGGKYKTALEVAGSAEDETAESEYISGLCYINLRNWNLALESLSSYIRKNPSYNKMALFYKGYAEYCLEQFKIAGSTFVKFASEADVKDLKYVRNAYEFATKASLQAGDYKNAALQAENLIKNSVNEKEKNGAIIFCSEIYCDSGDYAKAISFLEQYTKQRNEFAIQALFQIASIYVKQGNVQAADKTYTKIYTENQTSPYAEEAMYRSGEIFYSSGNYQTAQTKLNQYIYKYVNGKFSESAYFYCGDSCYRNGKIEESIMINKTLVQKYPKSIYLYGTYKNLMNAYCDTQNFTDALDAAKYLSANFSSQAKSDGVSDKLSELEIIVGGADPKVAQLFAEYERKGKTSTKDGRACGTELAKVYNENPDTKMDAYILASQILDSIKEDSEKFYAAQNAEIIADYYRANNENKDAAQMYLTAAEYYRSSSSDSTKAAAALYGAVDSFMAAGFTADAKETADLLIQLYPESRQAKNVRRLVK